MGAANRLSFRVPVRVAYPTLSGFTIAGLVGAHLLLGLLARQSGMAATLHALAVLGTGLYFAIQGRMLHTSYVAAYVIGAEVFWRMTGASMPWEFGKYALSLLLIVALVRSRRISGPLLPLCYFLLLLPATWFTFSAVEFGEARQLVSFNLSGPLALFVSAWFFSHMRLTPPALWRILLMVLLPTVSIFAVAFFGMIEIFRTGELIFHGDSNFATSGGFGPNQVSSMLGLGAICCGILAILTTLNRTQKLVLLAISAMLIAQSALTFSRSGLVLASGSVAVGAFFLMGDRRYRRILLVAAVVGGIIAGAFVLPRLNAFTGERMVERFTSLSTTNRGNLMQDELEIWQRRPLLGTGAGLGTVYRGEVRDQRVAAHTEFTRLLGEHGTLGLFALVLLLMSLAGNFRQARGTKSRAIIALAIAWTLLFMMVNAFRLAAPAFMIGLTFAALALSDRGILSFEPAGNEEPS